MIRLRAILRITGALLATLLACAVLIPTLALLPRASGLRRRVRSAVYRHWGRAAVAALGGRLTIVGELPSETPLLVTNHLSYVDIPLLAAVVDGVFVAKAEVRSWPLLGWVARIGGTLFVDRNSRRDTVRVGRDMAEWIDHGYSVVFFPEGTSGNGDEILPFRSPLLGAAAARQLPVLPAAIAYHTAPGDPPARDVVCWWGAAPLLPHLRRLLTLEPFEATICLSSTTLIDDYRKRLAERLRSEVAALAEQAARSNHS